MAKHIVRFLAIVTVVGLLICTSACSADGSSGNSTERTSVAPNADNDILATLTPEETFSTAILDTQPEELTIYNWIGIGSNYLYRAEGLFLQYYDFDQQAWFSLCSSPNCDHQTADCAAYVGDADWVSGIVEYDNKIYYLIDENMNQVSLKSFDPASQIHTSVCSLEDEMGEFSGEATICFVQNGKFLYREDMVSYDDSGSASRIVEIDLNTGDVTYSATFQLEEYSFVGVYQDILVGVYWDVNQDSDVSVSLEDYDDYYDYLSSLPYTMKVSIMRMGDESWTDQWVTEDAGDITYAYHNSCYGQYFIYVQGSNVSAVDILTGEQSTLFTSEGDITSLEGVIGDQLFYLVQDETGTDSEGNPVYETTGKYCLDLTTGANYLLGTSDAGGNPFYSTGEYFIQEGIQYIAKEDYYLGQWDQWISLY